MTHTIGSLSLKVCNFILSVIFPWRCKRHISLSSGTRFCQGDVSSQILISLPYNGCYVFSLSLTLYNFTEIYRFIIYTLLGVLHETSFVCVCVCVWSLCTHVCEFLHPHAKGGCRVSYPFTLCLIPLGQSLTETGARLTASKSASVPQYRVTATHVVTSGFLHEYQGLKLVF